MTNFKTEKNMQRTQAHEISMKKIIVVTGPSNVGKTTVIKATYHTLCKKFPAHTKVFENMRRGRDFCVVIEINGVIVGIDSRGDNEELLTNSLNFLADQKCHIILCAAHPGGGTIHAVEQFVRKHRYERYAPVTKLREIDESSQDKTNTSVTKEIVDNITALLT